MTPCFHHSRNICGRCCTAWFIQRKWLPFAFPFWSACAFISCLLVVVFPEIITVWVSDIISSSIVTRTINVEKFEMYFVSFIVDSLEVSHFHAVWKLIEETQVEMTKYKVSAGHWIKKILMSSFKVLLFHLILGAKLLIYIDLSVYMCIYTYII